MIGQDLKNKLKTFFTGLEFDAPSHTYQYEGQPLKSVSSVVARFVIPFETDKIAGYVAKSRGITKEEVLQEWEDKKNFACDRGNKAHNFGEHYTKDSVPSDGLETAIQAFWNSVPEHIIPVVFELQMFSKTLGIAGTADIILYNTRTGKFIICDYKTNEDLFKNYKGKKLLIPFGHLLDNNFNKYQIQLSSYQLLFELSGFEVESRRIIWLKPNGTFESFKTEDYTRIILKELTK